jgi:hypothetical protein
MLGTWMSVPAIDSWPTGGSKMTSRRSSAKSTSKASGKKASVVRKLEKAGYRVREPKSGHIPEPIAIPGLRKAIRDEDRSG